MGFWEWLSGRATTLAGITAPRKVALKSIVRTRELLQSPLTDARAAFFGWNFMIRTVDQHGNESFSLTAQVSFGPALDVSVDSTIITVPLDPLRVTAEPYFPLSGQLLQRPIPPDYGGAQIVRALPGPIYFEEVALSPGHPVVLRATVVPFEPGRFTVDLAREAASLERCDA